jgi:titin
MNRLSKLVAVVISPLLIVSSLTLGSTAAHAAMEPDVADLANARIQILNETNAARANAGLPPLQMNTALNEIAQGCSQFQAEEFQMQHCYGYENSYPAGWHWAAENVAAGYMPNTVVTGWMNSDGHRANILNPNATDIGIGYYMDDNGHRYYTQNFAGYVSTKTVPSAPGAPTVTTGDRSATLNWSVPATDGNLPITGYIVEVNDGRSVITQTFPTPSGTINDLTPGVTYTFRVVAQNSLGSGFWSPPAVATVLGSPQIVSVTPTATPNEITLNWEVLNGGSPLEELVVTVNGVARSVNVADVSATFTGLTPATGYSYTVYARNAYGNNSQSGYITTPATTPGTPTITNVERVGTRGVNVNWEAPDTDGGATITGYKVGVYDFLTNDLISEETVTGSSHTFNNLNRGSEYYFRVAAVNAVGAGDAGSQNLYIEDQIPTAPRNVIADLVDEQTITVSWDVPSDLGTENPDVELAYEVSVLVDGEVVDGVSTNLTTVTFDNTVINADTTYTFQVTAASNLVSGASPAGNSNEVVVPRTPTEPGPMGDLTVTGTTNTLTVEWEAPEDNGGSAITGYQLVLEKDGEELERIYVNEDEYSFTFVHLLRYTNYTVSVSAINDRGTGLNSFESFTTLPEAPSAVQDVTTTNLPNGRSIIGWNAPAETGGPSYLVYTVVVTVDGEEVFNEQTTSKFINTDVLPLNTDAVVTVTANNGVYDSPEESKNFATARTASSVDVTNVLYDQGGYGLGIFITEPADMGDFALVGYNVTINGVTEIVETDTPLTSLEFSKTAFGTLTKGQSYQVEVIALTGADLPGASGAPGVLAVPYTVPETVSNLQTNVDGNVVTFTWDAPEELGGYDIADINYSVTVNDGTEDVFADLTQNTELTVTLNNNTNYTVSVVAGNPTGWSTPAVEKAFRTDPTVPDAPSDLAIANGDEEGSVDLSWSAPYDGGTSITGYEYVLTVDGEEQDAVVVNGTTATVTGLQPNVSVSFTVRAINNRGYSDSAESDSFVTPIVKPGVVTGLSTNMVGTTVNVAWSAPSNTGGVQVEDVEYVVTFISSTEDTVTVNVGAGETSAEVTNLEAFAEYTVHVAAKNIAGTGTAVTGDTFRVGYVAPPAVTNLVLEPTSSTADSLTTHWDNVIPSYMDGYVTYKVELVDADGDVVVTDTTSNMAYTFPGLTRGAEYTTRVTAVLTGTGAPALEASSVESDKVEVPAEAPGVVRNVKVDATAGVEATVTWDAPTYNGGSTITRYDVVVFDADDRIYSDGNSVSGSFTIENLDPNTNYTVLVYAVNKVGRGEEVAKSFTTSVVKPGAVTNVEFDGNVVSWDAPVFTGGENVRYTVRVADSADEAVYTVGGLTGTSETVVYNYEPGQTYTVTVTAYNTAGSASGVTADYTEPAVVPTAPRNVALTVVNTDTLKATWDAPANNGGASITNYTVTYTNETTNVTLTLTTNELFADLSGLPAGGKYTVTVQANNSAGSSAASAESNPAETVPAELPEIVSEEELEDAIDGANEFAVIRNSSTLTVSITSQEAWLLGVAYSTPVVLGWDYAADGRLVFDISQVPAGDHTVVIYDADGNVLGYGLFNVPAAPSGGGNNGGTDGNTNTGGGSVDNSGTDTNPGPRGDEKNDNLARTGGVVDFPLLYGGVGLLLIGTVLAAIRRGRKEEVTSAE